jgi:hypothetical protein
MEQQPAGRSQATFINRDQWHRPLVSTSGAHWDGRQEGRGPKTTDYVEVFMWRQPPIWEPQGTKFRPYSITTLIFFYIGKFFGGLFKKRK